MIYMELLGKSRKFYCQEKINEEDFYKKIADY